MTVEIDRRPQRAKRRGQQDRNDDERFWMPGVDPITPQSLPISASSSAGSAKIMIRMVWPKLDEDIAKTRTR